MSETQNKFEYYDCKYESEVPHGTAILSLCTKCPNIQMFSGILPINVVKELMVSNMKGFCSFSEYKKYEEII
ncbi:MAG: hypothetical protein ACT6FE_05040 [Methanosarcinaceae archaeon]